MSKIELRSGKYWDYINPKEEDVDVENIAYSLSKEPRFSNQLDADWSVLQHVLLVRALLELVGESKELQYEGLHHDNPEAYFRDLPSPLKTLLKDYRRYYRKTAKVMELYFKTKMIEQTAEVEAMDKYSQNIERILFAPGQPTWTSYSKEKFRQDNLKTKGALERTVYRIYLLDRTSAIEEYLDWHYKLKPEGV